MHECGHPRSVCSDSDKLWYPQLAVCYATMEREAAAAKFARIHKTMQWHDGTRTSWAKEPSDAHPYRYDHGASIWVGTKDFDPDNNFLAPNLGGQHEPDDGDGEGEDG